MPLKLVIFTLSVLAISAYPRHRDTREATWNDSKSNQANEKADLSKHVDNLYKSHLDSSNLYNQGDDTKSPVAEELQHKLNMESERLRIRLRQELAELRERLSPSPARRVQTLAGVRERLAPFTQQLRSSLSSNTQDLCGQLSLYLQGLETADAQAQPSPPRYREAVRWMTQAAEQSGSRLADIVGDFHTKTLGAIRHVAEVGAGEEAPAWSELWQVVSSRLGQEVSSLRVETQNWVDVFKADLAALPETALPFRAEAAASMERFCPKAAPQSQVFQVQMEKLFQGLEEDLLEAQTASDLSPFSSSSSASRQPAGSLQEDFSVKLSALIEDILHSV